MWHCTIFKFATASLSKLILRKSRYLSTILPFFLLVLWVHFAKMKAIPHCIMADKNYFRNINSLRGACCAFQYCESLLKCGRIICWIKKFVLTSICKLLIWIFSQIVNNYVAYNLWKFHVDSFKIAENIFLSTKIILHFVSVRP